MGKGEESAGEESRLVDTERLDKQKESEIIPLFFYCFVKSPDSKLIGLIRDQKAIDY